MEIQRIYEVTATPATEGANLSEFNRTIRGFGYQNITGPLRRAFFISARKESKEGEEENHGKITVYLRICNGRTSG